ncbi:nucleotidyltransferase family protein [Patescibacteria group bacterium]|nr:nucleotidyltransferase family protein [Pseudomonadota bacterium]MBU2233981.1 nucleotidyltransferase family protein [Patescibacteria group bacterium]MBU2264453.1 nucleotidyltransferase family protein [Patescibacteria group bacterium]
MNIQEIRQTLEKNSEYIKKTFFVKEFGVFGSYVKDEQKPESDVDILVAFESGHKDFFNYMRLKYCLEELIGKKVDLVIKEAVKSRLRDKIFSEVVYV